MRKILLLLYCLCLLPAAAAQEQFDVNAVWFDKKENSYAVRVDLQVGQHELIDKILRSGYVLDFNFELHFMQRRDWLFDRFVGDISWHNKLNYDSVIDRYLLVSGSKKQRYSSLAAALEKISRLRAGYNSDEEYVKILQRDDIYVRSRFYLYTKNLPEPIQIGLLLDGDIETGSDWLVFPLEIRE